MNHQLIVYENMEKVCVQVGKQMVQTIREKLVEDKDATLSDEQIKEISAPILETFKAEVESRSAREAEELLEKQKDRMKQTQLEDKAFTLKRHWRDQAIVNVNDAVFSVEEQACKRVKRHLQGPTSSVTLPEGSDVTIQWQEPSHKLKNLDLDPDIWTYSWSAPSPKYCQKVVAKVDDKISNLIFGKHVDIVKSIVESGVVEIGAFQARFKELVQLSRHNDDQNEELTELLSIAEGAFKGKGVNFSFFIDFIRRYSELSYDQRGAVNEIFKNVDLFDATVQSSYSEEEDEEEQDEMEEEKCTAEEIGECACPKCCGSGSNGEPEAQ